MEEQILQCDPHAGAPAPEVEAPPRLADVSPNDLARQRYSDVIGGLVDDALKNKSLPVLSNVMAVHLAWVIVEYGPNAAGHVLERLGSHISYFVERNRAAKEAAEAREEGRLVN